MLFDELKKHYKESSVKIEYVFNCNPTFIFNNNCSQHDIEHEQLSEWLKMCKKFSEMSEMCNTPNFTLGGWVLFYRDDVPLSIYRVVDIGDTIKISGGGRFTKQGKDLFDDMGFIESSTHIIPISAEKAMYYVKNGYYIREEDKIILEKELNLTTSDNM